MNKIVLNDGTEIEDGVISSVNDFQIYVAVPGTNLIETITTFSDTKKTKKMTCYASVYKYEYTGFTQISSASVNTDRKTTELYMEGKKTSVKTSYTVPEEYLPKEMRNEEGGSK